MTRRRKRPNIFGWAVFGLILLFGYYFDQVYLPTQPNPFDATPTVTRSPESFVTEAQKLFQEGKLTQAIDAYESAIKSSPQDPTLYIALARVQVFASLPHEAQTNAENAILLSPNNSMAHAVLAWALDFEGENGKAMEEIDTALQYDDKNAIAHAYRVEILIDSGSFENTDKAREVSRTALALDPNLLETRRARGYIFEATGDYENAIQFYKSAIELNPNLALLHMELGRNLRFLQVSDQAIDEFLRANTLNPSDPEPEYWISRTYGTTGEYEKALQYAEASVKDRPTDARLRANYGVMYYYNFFYTKAAEQLSLALNGGRTEDGFPIQGIPLSDDLRIAEYYYTYGFALARTNECGDALRIVQSLRTNVAENETVTNAADSITQICEENLNNPAVDTPIPDDEVTPTEEIITSTPEVTPTP